MVTVASLPMTRQATCITDSQTTGLTLPGMIDDPGWIAGRLSSPIPQRGPEPRWRMSLAILESETAIVFSSPWAATNESLAACGVCQF